MNITILKRTAHHSYGEVVVDDIVGDLVAVPVKDNTYYGYTIKSSFQHD